jgi:hypothetical protein
MPKRQRARPEPDPRKMVQRNSRGQLIGNKVGMSNVSSVPPQVG